GLAHTLRPGPYSSLFVHGLRLSARYLAVLTKPSKGRNGERKPEEGVRSTLSVVATALGKPSSQKDVNWILRFGSRPRCISSRLIGALAELRLDRQKVGQGGYLELDVFPRALHGPEDSGLDYRDQSVDDFADVSVNLFSPHRLRILDMSRVSLAHRSNSTGSPARSSLTHFIARFVSSSSGASRLAMSEMLACSA